MDHQHKVSRRERQIMDLVYEMGKASVNEVLAKMEDPPGRTAIRTFMRILEEKGFLKHHKEGREYIYQVVGTRKKAGRHAFNRVLNTFFEGSLANALTAHLANPKDNISKEELDQLSQLIMDAKQQRKL